MYLLYMALCLVSSVVVFFFIPETHNLPMEELAALFGDEVVVHLTADGHGIVEDEALDVDVGSAPATVTELQGKDGATFTSHMETIGGTKV
jgi:hypothetical protein